MKRINKVFFNKTAALLTAWSVLFAALVPLCDDGSDAFGRAQALINGANGCIVTHRITDVEIEWKCIEIFDNFKRKYDDKFGK